MPFETSKAGSQVFNALFTITSNIERISDHSVNIAEYSHIIDEKGISFSGHAYGELDQMQQICANILVSLLEKPADYVSWHEKIACMEQKMDDMTIQYRDNMYQRIHAGECSDDGSILFSEMLTDFERIGDHALNIANEMLNIAIIER